MGAEAIPGKVRGTILSATDLRSRLAHMRVAVTATAAMPPQHATPARPARPQAGQPGNPCPRRPIIPAVGTQRQGRLRRRCAPCDPGHRPRDLAAITAMGRAGTPRTRHATKPDQQQKLDRPLHMRP